MAKELYRFLGKNDDPAYLLVFSPTMSIVVRKIQPEWRIVQVLIVLLSWFEITISCTFTPGMKSNIGARRVIAKIKPMRRSSH